jgi:hypothetical protein
MPKDKRDPNLLRQRTLTAMLKAKEHDDDLPINILRGRGANAKKKHSQDFAKVVVSEFAREKVRNHYLKIWKGIEQQAMAISEDLTIQFQKDFNIAWSEAIKAIASAKTEAELIMVNQQIQTLVINPFVFKINAAVTLQETMQIYTDIFDALTRKSTLSEGMQKKLEIAEVGFQGAEINFYKLKEGTKVDFDEITMEHRAAIQEQTALTQLLTPSTHTLGLFTSQTNIPDTSSNQSSVDDKPSKKSHR